MLKKDVMKFKKYLLFFLVSFFLIVSFLIFIFLIKKQESSETSYQLEEKIPPIPTDSEKTLLSDCISDNDCVPSSCCHSDSCVPIKEKPSCDKVFCSMECRPNTLDCGQGECKCINSKCVVIFN